MFFSVDLITQDFVEHYIFSTPEEVFLNLRIGLFELCDQILGLEPFGADISGLGAQIVLLREFTGTLQEAEAVVIAPCLDIFFADQIHGAYQFHAFEVGAPEFGHHSLILAGVEHSHEYGLNGIVIVVPQRYFVAAKIFGPAVQISPSHSRAEIAGGFFYMKDGIEDRRVEDRYRNSKESAVLFDQRPVLRKVSGIHTEEGQFEGELIMTLDLLKELGHEHGVLASGDTDRNVISLLYETVLNDRLFKPALKIVFKLFFNTFFNVFLTGGGIIPVQGSDVKSCQSAPLIFSGTTSRARRRNISPHSICSGRSCAWNLPGRRCEAVPAQWKKCTGDYGI